MKSCPLCNGREEISRGVIRDFYWKVTRLTD